MKYMGLIFENFTTKKPKCNPTVYEMKLGCGEEYDRLNIQLKHSSLYITLTTPPAGKTSMS